MRILLIGGSGFIGPHTARALVARGHDVTVFHRGRTPAPPRTAEITGDRRRITAHAAELRSVRADVVVDFALSSGEQARDIMAVFRGVARRIVAVSSCDVYRAVGVTHGFEEGPLEPLPLRETSALRTKLQTYPPASIAVLQQVFGWLDDAYDKIPVEREILGDAELPGTILRLPMVYGPGDPLHRFLPMVKRAADGRRAMLISSEMAAWRATKGYVEDVGAAIALAAVSDRATGRIYNVGEADAPTEIDWARAVARALAWHAECVVLPEERMPAHLRQPGNTGQHWVTDTSRIRQELGFEESVTREEAIRRTVDWERTHPPSGFTPHQFNYGDEDRAIADSANS